MKCCKAQRPGYVFVQFGEVGAIMALQIIGSGFGRTGTLSLKVALETLAFTPCHHMDVVWENPLQVPFWQDVAAGRTPDWAKVFAGFAAQVDWPGAHVWRETAAAFPQAKVIHSRRPDEKWWASFSRTIGKLMTLQQSLDVPPHVREMFAVVMQIIGQQTFGGRWTDRDAALAAYHKREADVRAAIPASRLLVFDVVEGWGPLCAFLGVPVPETPFPHRNKVDEFWKDIGGEPA